MKIGCENIFHSSRYILLGSRYVFPDILNALFVILTITISNIPMLSFYKSYIIRPNFLKINKKMWLPLVNVKNIYLGTWKPFFHCIPIKLIYFSKRMCTDLIYLKLNSLWKHFLFCVQLPSIHKWANTIVLCWYIEPQTSKPHFIYIQGVSI